MQVKNSQTTALISVILACTFVVHQGRIKHDLFTSYWLRFRKLVKPRSILVLDCRSGSGAALVPDLVLIPCIRKIKNIIKIIKSLFH